MVTFPSALSCLESIQISSSKLKFKSEISFGLSINCSPPIVSIGNKLISYKFICCPPIAGNGPFSFCHKPRANSLLSSNASARKMSLGTCLKYFLSNVNTFPCKLFDLRTKFRLLNQEYLYFMLPSDHRIPMVASWKPNYGECRGVQIGIEYWVRIEFFICKSYMKNSIRTQYSIPIWTPLHSP